MNKKIHNILLFLGIFILILLTISISKVPQTMLSFETIKDSTFSLTAFNWAGAAVVSLLLQGIFFNVRRK